MIGGHDAPTMRRGTSIHSFFQSGFIWGVRGFDPDCILEKSLVFP